MTGPFFFVRRSLRQHALSTTITVLSVALAAGLVMSVFAINRQTREAFAGGDPGYDAVLGARGSQLQLVLNAVFHLETSPGNLPWRLFEAVRKDPRVEWAIPYATGDNYRGHRIVGTTELLFVHLNGIGDEPLFLEGEGRFFDSRYREAVIGSFVAAKTGLKVGDKFNPYHGLSFDESKRHEEEYLVVGVLEPTNSPTDRVIFIPIEGIFRLGGHYLRGTGEEEYQAQPGKEIPDEHKEVSTVLLRFKEGNTMAGFQLRQDINLRGKEATLAWPIGNVMADLFKKLGWVTRVLEMVAYLVVAVAAGSILASIYNTMNERRREFAILRALGARRATVFTTIVAEAASIAAVGTLVGYLVYGAILAASAYVIRAQTGVVLDVFSLHAALWLTPIGMIVLGALAGVLPAAKAYSTDVAENLVPHS